MRRYKVSESLGTMVQHYLICALWSSHDWQACKDESENPPPMDDRYDVGDVSISLYNQSVADCRSFVKMAEEQGIEWEQSWEQIGHDFWLTRNGHGAGFWDRGIKHGDALTKLSKVFGSVDLWTSNGKVMA